MNKRGFTLIEMLIVIAIIGMLSTLAAITLGSARVKARDARRMSDLKEIQTALELYYTDENIYPAGNNIALGSANYACLNEISGFTTAGCLNPYMDKIPADPKSGNYIYTRSSDSYTVTAALEGKINNLGPSTIHLTPSGIGN